MQLLVWELDNTFSWFQEFRPTSNINALAIRPHIYRHNSPAGSLQLKILDENSALIATSNSVTISSIGTDDFFHGYIKFDINVSLRADTRYRLQVEGVSGYVFNESAYVGVCKDHDLQKVTRNYDSIMGTVPGSTSFNSAIDFEIWERTDA